MPSSRESRIRASCLLAVLGACLSVLVPGTVQADDAAVLPRGVWGLALDSKFYLPTDTRFGPDGDEEDIAADFNRSLDDRVFRALAPLDPFVPGRPTLGRSVVSFDWQLIYFDLTLLYGLTDRLTIGANVPYRWARNEVRARVDPATANVGRNPRFGQPSQPPLIPVAAGGRPLTTEDVRALLGRGLDVNGDGRIDIPGFGYKRFETWEGSGFGDAEAGARYQYLRTTDWRLAFTGGMRFPTGRVDDPDNLTDTNFGSGAFALLFRLNNDYVLSNLWKDAPSSGEAPGDLVLNGTFRYDLLLPDKQNVRVTDDVNNPITVNRENVSRDLGDRFEFEVSARYVVGAGLSASALYLYAFELEDEVSGNRGFAYQSLERETARTEHVFIVGLSYSTVAAYRAGRFPLPGTIGLRYRNRFAGSNNVFKTQYIGLELELFF